MAVVSAILSNAGMNIATIKAHRDSRGGNALMAVELDTSPSDNVLIALSHLPQFEQVRIIPSLGFGG